MLDRIAKTAVRRIVVTGLHSMLPHGSVKDALLRMREFHCGALAVVDDDGRLCGIFTERDVLIHSRKGEAWLQMPVSGFMTPDPVTVHKDETLLATVQKMREGNFRHLPLVDDAGKAIGIVSIRDVLSYVADNFPQEILNLPVDPSLETRKRWGG